MRILVTGGAGFIGSALVRHLVLDVGAEVLTFDKLTYAGSLSNLSPVSGHANHRFAKGDICDRAALDHALATFKPTRIYHLAAESHVDRSISGAADFIHTNVTGTFTLLEASRAFLSSLDAAGRAQFRFLHVSTDEVYGSLGTEGQFTETTPYDPSSPYSASKAASNHLVMAWRRTYDFPAIVSNCSNNYGPYHFPEKLIPVIILNAIHGQTIPIYGNGSHVRDWLHVEDHIRALHLIASHGRVGETYNVGGRSERRNIDVARKICALLDERAPQDRPYDSLISFVSDRPGHDARYAIDPVKLESELGWRARESFDTGIAKTVDWYLANEAWWKPLRERVSDGERPGILPRGA